MKEAELVEMIGDFEVTISGTESITEQVLDAARNLRLIARVGVGLDSVPLQRVRKLGIMVTYTPDAPTPAVAEFTIGQTFALLRHTIAADTDMRRGKWERRMGRRLEPLTLGVIGIGRIGRLVVKQYQIWNPQRILLNDLVVDQEFSLLTGSEWAEKDTIYRYADVITLHVPLTNQTRNLIGERELAMMKPDAILINTSRGGIVNEDALAQALRRRPSFSAALDVFSEEPYHGELIGLPNCYLTSHMAAATQDCRLRMEVEAVQDVVRYFRSEPLLNVVPENEYSVQVNQ